MDSGRDSRGRVFRNRERVSYAPYQQDRRSVRANPSRSSTICANIGSKLKSRILCHHVTSHYALACACSPEYQSLQFCGEDS
ncbi:hypothetical protein vseg_003657 [Gypsophila vaccaria]